MHTKVQVAGQSITTPSTSVADQPVPTVPIAQPCVAPTTPEQAASHSHTAATRIQWVTSASADVQPLTGRTDVAPP